MNRGQRSLRRSPGFYFERHYVNLGARLDTGMANNGAERLVPGLLWPVRSLGVV